jgi:hypothetical protein
MHVAAKRCVLLGELDVAALFRWPGRWMQTRQVLRVLYGHWRLESLGTCPGDPHGRDLGANALARGATDAVY